MKKNILLILILVNCINFSCTVSSPNSTPSNTITMKNFEIPKQLKVIIYTQVDKGRPNAGSDKHIGVDGKIYYMGRADYQPFVKKCETILSEKQSAELLNSNLIFLPYFREIKPTITLQTYFETIQDTTHSADLFPKNLDGYYAYPKDDRMFFNTLLGHEIYPKHLIRVIYANETTYYIEEVYYRMEADLPAEVFVTNCDDSFKEGELMDFIRTSDFIQNKIEEGKTTKIPPPAYKDTDLVASFATSACLGECPVFKLEIYGSGKIKYRGTAYVEKIGSYETQTSKEKINLLIQKAVESNYLENAQAQFQNPVPHVHDGTSLTMTILLDGMSRTITCGGGQKCSKEIVDFYDFFHKLFEEEIKGL